jgi:hypothetical protein
VPTSNDLSFFGLWDKRDPPQSARNRCRILHQYRSMACGVDTQSYNESFKTTLAPTQRLTRWGTLHLAACGVSGT